MDEEDESKCDCPAGLPGWLATFADLMSLLMCFFVLLLSFAELDVVKLKRLAGSMREAFGVQSEIEATSIPKGTSVIAQQYSPGRPEPTPIRVLMEQTTRMDEPTLQRLCQSQIEDARDEMCQVVASPEAQSKAKDVLEKVNGLIAETEKNAVALAVALESEVRNEQVEIETRQRSIVIRLREKGTFASGSAQLNYDFLPVLEKVTEMLNRVDGSIQVQGHTDNVPLKRSHFRSNWDLSAARALEVTHALFELGLKEPSRVAVSGFADTLPLVPNDNPGHRSRNRRVEIVLKQAIGQKLQQDINQVEKELPGFLRQHNLGQLWNLRPGEIF